MRNKAATVKLKDHCNRKSENRYCEIQSHNNCFGFLTLRWKTFPNTMKSWFQAKKWQNVKSFLLTLWHSTAQFTTMQNEWAGTYTMGNWHQRKTTIHAKNRGNTASNVIHRGHIFKSQSNGWKAILTLLVGLSNASSSLLAQVHDFKCILKPSPEAE